MSTFLIRFATSQSSSYPIVLTRLTKLILLTLGKFVPYEFINFKKYLEHWNLDILIPIFSICLLQSDFLCSFCFTLISVRWADNNVSQWFLCYFLHTEALIGGSLQFPGRKKSYLIFYLPSIEVINGDQGFIWVIRGDGAIRLELCHSCNAQF